MRARLLLGNRNPDLGHSADGGHDTFALLWDMNVLFEEYVGRLAQEVLATDELDVALQHASTYLAREPMTDRNAFLLRPDLLVRRQQRPWVVADTKWKRLDARQMNLGISEADVYQVLAYAHRLETDQAVLIYPHHPAVGRPGLRKEFVVEIREPRQVRLRIVTLDLARISEVPDQLQHGLLFNPTRAC